MPRGRAALRPRAGSEEELLSDERHWLHGSL
jgi:hypothetical protein